MSHSNALREPRQSPSYAPAKHKSAMHARIVESMPDLDAAAVDRLASICSELPPPGHSAANSADTYATDTARHYATRKGMAGMAEGLLEESIGDMSRIDWLLASITVAASEDVGDGAWVTALCDIGASWTAGRRRDLRELQSHVLAAVNIVDREEGTA